MAFQLHLILLILTFACMSLQAITSQGPDNESRVHGNLKNFFDSISRKDMRKSEVLHEVLKDEVEGDQLAFQTLRKELQEIRNKNTDFKILSKREIRKCAGGTRVRDRGTKEADGENAEDTESWKRKFDSLRETARSYDDFLRSMEERLENDESQSDAHFDDKETYYASYIAATDEDQRRQYRKRNYDFRMKTLNRVQKARSIKGATVSELKTVRERISGNGTSAEQMKQLMYGVQLLQNATHSFSSFVEGLESSLTRELYRAQKGTTIHTWCTAGTCEFGDEPYRFRDGRHLDWLELTLHKIEKLRSRVNES